MKRIFASLLILALCLCGCKKAPVSTPEPTAPSAAVPVETEPVETEPDATEPAATESSAPSASAGEQEMFTQRDSDPSYNESAAVKITLKGSSAAASSDAVKINNGVVKLTEAATYLVSGTLDDGMLVVDAPKDAKVQIVLNGANITSETYAPLLVLQADKVFVTLAGENSLTAGESFTPIDDIDIDGAVFAKSDLTFNGAGSLTVTSPAGHGIVCKDDLVFAGGNYTVSSASHAIDANDSVRIASADITAQAGKDGIHAENSDDAALGYVYISGGSFRLEAQGDGISAGSSLQISDGSFNITAGGGSENGEQHSSEGYGGFGGGFGGGGRPQRPGGRAATTTDTTDSTSMKGLKSGTDLQISGGTFQIDSADDGLHANGSLTLEKGSLTIATGDDGIHAENTLSVTGGAVSISESYEGLEALHIRVSGGDITLTATDDGLNAAGGVDQSGMGGRDDGQFVNTAMGFPGGGFGSSNSNGSIVISGGTLNITASGDGIDANGTLEITGGHTTVCGPTQGDTATLDYDKSGTISGGTFIGTGAAGMAQNITGDRQGVVYIRAGNIAANTKLTLTDGNGNVLIEHTPGLGYNVVILSSPDIQKGGSYTLTVGTQTSQVTAS